MARSSLLCPGGMLSQLRTLRDRLLGSLWFVPSTIVLASIGLAFAMVVASERVDDDVLARWPRLFGASAESSRSMLSAIAGSMITVAGLSFSLMLLAVTQASSQFTPRILRNFMQDRANQVVLGTYVGVFTYCLVVLRTIRDADEPFVPSLAVVVAIILAIAGVGVLIYFVHHIATTLQASSIMARVARDTTRAVDELFPATLGAETDDGSPAARAVAGAAGWRPVLARATGYIQRVDEDGMLRLAEEQHQVIRMERGIGDFVIADTPLASFAPLRAVDPDRPVPRELDGEAFAGRVARLFVVGDHRTVAQDAAFGVRQLVDIALKALSPGVNETTTAVGCIDYLGAILVRLAGRRIESPARESDGALRVLARGPTFESLLRLACDQIRLNSTDNPATLGALLSMLHAVAEHTSSPRRRQLVARQIELVGEVIERTVAAPHDRGELRARAESALAACHGDAEPGYRREW